MKAHASTAVDALPDPDAWVGVLDAVRSEPAYVAYERRVAELLDPRRVGAGLGPPDRRRRFLYAFTLSITVGRRD